MRENYDAYELDEPKAANAKLLLAESTRDPIEYAKGAIAACEEQLKTARGKGRIAKLNASIRRWRLVLSPSPAPEETK